MLLSSGSKLGPYEIIAPLGAGGMGEVYRARDPQLGRDVAIKVLPASFSRDPDRLRRFEQEARAAAALNHPNILAVYQMGTHEGSPYLVSELLEGSTLREQLLRGPMPVRKAMDYATQAAHGLAAAHEKGIVHRDLKPENLFLTKDGRIKILDFGLAKLIPQPHASDPATPTMTEGTEPGVVLGTVGYMSPEQVRGHAADDRTDIFALGAILYEMLTGKRAFHKPTHAETMSAILNEEPPSASQINVSIPPALQKVVQRCLEKSPQQRFHSASDLAFALEALSDSSSAPATSLSTLRSRPWKNWVPALAVFIMLAVLLLAWLGRPASVPTVEAVTQLTDDGQPKGGVQFQVPGLKTDGARIYLNEGLSNSMGIVQFSVGGGETGSFPTQLVNPQIADITKDDSALLVISSTGDLWSLPLPVGSARSLGIGGTSAALFADGRVAFTGGAALYISSNDGSSPRKVAEIPPLGAVWPAVSPDGKRIVFSSFSDALSLRWGAMYEIQSDGSGLHPILQPGQHGLPRDICCGTWTPDGKYLLFEGKDQGRWDLWTLAQQVTVSQRAPKPLRLTNGPLSYNLGTVSRDGKRILAIGSKWRGELVRYDPKLRQLIPYLGGISAFDETFSRDGKWMAYVSYPDHTVWRSRSDGTDRLQLTYSPQVALYPRISADATNVSFSDLDGNAYLVSMQGGTPRKITDNAVAPSWSPDGNSWVFNSIDPGKAPNTKGYFQTRVMDLRTGTASLIPEAGDSIGPWFLSADTIVTYRSNSFVVLNLKNRKSAELARFSDYTPAWAWAPSVDGRYLYYTTGGADPKAYRITIGDHRVEMITSLKNLRIVDDPYESVEINVAPDGSALFTRDIGTQEVYALSVNWP